MKVDESDIQFDKKGMCLNTIQDMFEFMGHTAKEDSVYIKKYLKLNFNAEVVKYIEQIKNLINMLVGLFTIKCYLLEKLILKTRKNIIVLKKYIF